MALPRLVRLAVSTLLLLACQSPSPPMAKADPPPATAPDADPVPGQPCLRRGEVGNDVQCHGHGMRPHFFYWDEHACAVATEAVAEISKHCDRIGPDRAMNVGNWCCP